MGLKRDFRLVVRGAARNMAAILNGSCELTWTLATFSIDIFYFSSKINLFKESQIFLF